MEFCSQPLDSSIVLTVFQLALLWDRMVTTWKGVPFGPDEDPQIELDRYYVARDRAVRFLARPHRDMEADRFDDICANKLRGNRASRRQSFGNGRIHCGRAVSSCRGALRLILRVVECYGGIK